MSVFDCLFILLLAGLAGTIGNVTVVRLQLSHEEEYTLTLNSSIEYMLEFTPNSEQMQFPSSVYLKTDGGDIAHPLLITSRQRTGAVSWQLPYLSQGETLYELEATLCPDDSRYDIASECSEHEPYLRRNAFTLHVSSTCVADVHVTVRATPVRDFFLPFQSSTELVTRLAAPKGNSGEAILRTVEEKSRGKLIISFSNRAPHGQPSPYLLRNAFTLHVSSTCVADVHVTVRATPVRDFFQSSTELVTRLAAPKVFFYQFRENQESVRLVMESQDEVCALVSIQNCTCPILQTEDQIQLTGVRFTMLQSGGVQLSRSRFPNGFYVVTIVKAADTDCLGDDNVDSWLQLALAWDDGTPEQIPPRTKTLSIRMEVELADTDCLGDDSADSWLQLALAWDDGTPEQAPPRTKTLFIRMEASLTRTEYATATVVTLVVFVLFYVLFFGVVLAQRWPAFAKHVSPKAPPAEFNLTETQIEGETGATLETPHRRQRRSSTATFDSSNNSDTDDEYEDLPPRNVTNATSNVANPPANLVTTPSNVGNNVSNVGNGDSTTNSAGLTGPIEGGNGVGTVTDGAMVAGRNGAIVVESNGAIVVEGNGAIVAEEVTVVELNSVQFQVPEDAQTAVAPPPAYRDWTPFGLPQRLNLASLSRRRARVLRVRSDRYLYTLYTVAVFYALPVVQFVSAFQIVFNVSGSLDICYYNFLCSHPAGALSDFNHVFSNLGYMLLGALFMLQLRRRRQRRKNSARNEDYGIPAHYGLLSSLGAGMMVVGVLSASYHVCPNRLNFQFDTAFMYVLAVLSMVKIYQSRHPDVNARAHATFGILAVLIALVVWGVLGSGPFFWAIFTVLHLFTFLLLSLRIYYVGQFRLEKDTLQRAARQLAAMPKLGVRPLYRARLVMLLIANGVNWAFALWGLWTQTSDFAGHLLQLLLLNALIHMIFYLVMKLLHKERPRWYAWCFLAGAAAAWAPALYFFLSGSSDWSATPALSRHLNHECKVLQFYDSHDLWHMLSAVALYLSFNAMLTWDDGLAAVKRTDIAVF